jgi:predicted RNA-binding protein with PIN domain
VTVLLVDGNNVIGSVPDGWWRDRPGAVRRLVARLQCFAAGYAASVQVVFDVAQPDLPEGDHDGVTVHYATRRGRDAADDRILELLEARVADGADEAVEVVTSDRALADGARRLGATVVGAGTLLDRLAAADC